MNNKYWRKQEKGGPAHTQAHVRPTEGCGGGTGASGRTRYQAWRYRPHAAAAPKRSQGVGRRGGKTPLQNKEGVYRYFSMVCTSVALGTAPMTVSIFWPPLKIITVGMLRMP